MTSLLLFLFLQNFTQSNQWQVPFSIEKAALSPSGTSVFLSNGKIYTYARNGTLIHEFDYNKSAQELWMDQSSRIWIKTPSTLTIFTPNGVALLEKEMEETISNPFFIRDCTGIVTTAGISILSLNSKKQGTSYGPSLCLNELSFKDIYSTNYSDERVIVCDQNGDSLVWYPFEETSYIFMKQRKIKFMVEDGLDFRAIVFDDRTLEVETPRKEWTRKFTLDINQKPIWLKHEKRKALIFLSEDRVLRIFLSNGLELNRKLFSYRPDTLIQLDSHRCMISFLQSNILAFYNLKTNTFSEETSKANLTHILKKGNYLLLIDIQGHIKINHVNAPILKASSPSLIK